MKQDPRAAALMPLEPAAADAPAQPSAAPARSLLGLPARLALLSLLAVATCVAGITASADHRLRIAADERIVAETVTAARVLAEQFGEADFRATEDAQFGSLLDDRLARAANRDPGIRAIVLYGPAGRDGALQAVGDYGASSRGAMLAQARRAYARAVEVTERLSESDDRARAFLPVTFVDGSPAGVVAVEYSASTVAQEAGTVRLRLLLGSVIGGALLGALLLMLLRRELFRPLIEMRRTMALIGSGVQGVRIGWTRGDELGAVARDFDAMVGELEEAQQELAKYVKQDPLTGLLTREAFTERFSAELTRARREGYPVALLAIDVDDLDEINGTHDTAAGDQVLAALGEVIRGSTRPTDCAGRTGGDSFHVALVGADAAQSAVVIERVRREVAQRLGVGPERTRVTCGFGVAEYPTHAVDQLALERMSLAACEQAQRAGRDRAIAFGPSGGYVDALSLAADAERADAQRPAGARELASTVHALARALDGIDPVLGGGAHSERVARYAIALARELELDDAQMRELRSAAVLHDVGKVAVPAHLLRLPEGELDDEQRARVEQHPSVARAMISGAGLDAVAEVVFRASEHWDGSGHPDGLRGTDIPLASRLLHAAELLDQLTCGVGGAAPMSPEEAAVELERRAGGELDPDVAERLARLARDGQLISAPKSATSNPAPDPRERRADAA